MSNINPEQNSVIVKIDLPPAEEINEALLLKALARIYTVEFESLLLNGEPMSKILEPSLDLNILGALSTSGKTLTFKAQVFYTLTFGFNACGDLAHTEARNTDLSFSLDTKTGECKITRPG